MNFPPPVVIIVDSNADRLAQSVAALGEAFAAVGAASAEDALKRAETSPPDLILLESRTGASVAGVCAQLRASCPTRGVPLAVIAASVDASAKQQAVDFGADDVVDGTALSAAGAGRLYRLIALGRPESLLKIANRVLGVMKEGVMVTDAADRIVEVNPAFCLLTGYSRDELIGKTPTILKSGRHDDEFFRALWEQLGQTGEWSGEIWNRMKNGDAFPQLVNINRLQDGAGNASHYVAVFSDIRIIKDQLRQLERLAYYDPLTDLPNRSLLEDRIHQAIAHTLRIGGLVGVGFLDLDGFRTARESLGQEAGDLILLEVAKRLTDLLRAGDTVARIGGDEFVFLLIGVETPDECSSITGRIIKLIAEPMNIAGREVNMSASVGLTFAPTDSINPEILIGHAEEAMLAVKAAGKNGFRVYQPSDEAAGC